jgi:fatty-acyl-CoA synthase
MRALHAHDERACLIEQGTTWSYAEVRSAVYRTARALVALGAERGQGIALLSRNTVAGFVAQAAALLIGCRYTPLHPLASADDQCFNCEDADVRFLIVDSWFAERLGVLHARLGADLHVLTVGAAEVGADLVARAQDEPDAPLQPVPAADDLCWLVYTGGTTGTPKGVMLSHRAMAWMTTIMRAEWELAPRTRLLAVTPMSHAVGTMAVPVLLGGGSIVLHHGFDPERFVRDVVRLEVSATFLVPTMLYTLLGRVEDDSWTAGLQTLVYGAAPISPARLREGLERWGQVFFQLYGQTEFPTTAMVMRRGEHLVDDVARLASCGRPVPYIDVMLGDASGTRVDDGDAGEILLRGPLSMDGYWKRPEITAETLRGGWVHTGDIARCDAQGFYQVVDRAKDMIVTGGFNVFPREVEDVLTSHADVVAAAVVGVPDDHWGEAVRALVVLRAGAAPIEPELRDLVRESKGPVSAPKVIEFVQDLPMTALGKPDKQALRARYWGGQARAVH